MSSPAPSLEQLLAAHPWPKEFAARPRLDFCWHFEVGLPLEQLWPLVSDTSRMNRALGVTQMHFAPRGDGELWGTARNGGLLHEWLEVPWNWVTGQWLESQRTYKTGFAECVWAVMTFEVLGPEKTRVNVYFGMVPRHLVGKLALKLGFGALEKEFRRVFGDLEAQYAAAQRARMPTPAVPPLPPDVKARLAQALATVTAAGVDRDAAQRLLTWVETGDDDDLVRIQLKERAAAWGVDLQALLGAALHLTREGVLEISWDLICPHCRGPTEKVGELGALKAGGACPLCEIDFDSRGAESVEITFHVHPSVRAVAQRAFCSAEPSRKGHIKLQKTLAPGEALTVTPHLAPGRYRLRAHGEKTYGFLEVNDRGADAFTWTPGFTERGSVKPTFALTLQNPDAAPTRVTLEAATWSDLALRPGELFSLQEYRDLFSEDYLAADVQLAIGEQTILFTDIVGSTAMYATRGDPAAFVEVRRHFDEVFAEIAKYRGAVVKTIGDAVMATFGNALDAVRASQAIHARFPPKRADSTTKLRISLNTGPCIAVKLNTGVDYFGHTVNLAAKLQSLAESWQVAMSEATWRSPGVGDFLSTQGALTELQYKSKALPEPVPVRQWTLFSE